MVKDRTIESIAGKSKEVAIVDLIKRCFGEEKKVFPACGDFFVKEGDEIVGEYYAFKKKIVVKREDLLKKAENFNGAYKILFGEDISVETDYS